jgi:hypothetical protein
MKLLLVAGSAPCLQEDALRFKGLATEDMKGECHLMCIGLDAFKKNFQPWTYVVTGHFEDIFFIKEYAKLQHRNGFKIIHQSVNQDVKIAVPLDQWNGGSSALMGVIAGLGLGYNKIVLCGCPMEGPNPGHPGADYSMFQEKWIKEYLKLIPMVKSMSGFTKDLLGEPTAEWLLS